MVRKIIHKSPLLNLILLTLILSSSFVVPAEAQSTSDTSRTYYIDSQNGDDGNDGLSEDSAWQSHTMISDVALLPGDTVAFKRGSQFSGPVLIRDSGSEGKPITITAYGEGDAPRFTNPNDRDMNGNTFRLGGSWIILENLYFHDTPPTRLAGRPQSIFKMGAVFNMAGANHNIIRNNTFINCTKAIQSTGEYTLITNNYLEGPDHPLWIGDAGTEGWGPIGIHLGIGNQEISYNTIKNYLTTDSPYGSDGGAIELDDGRYHKDNFYIHHNYTEGNAGFLESSWGLDYMPFKQEVHNLRLAFNVNFDGQSWIYMWAPCHDCTFDNNTIIRTDDFDSPSNGVVFLDFGDIQFRNNLFVYTADDVYTGDGASGIVTEGNWYFNADGISEQRWDRNASGSGDPHLVDLAEGDYHPTCNSPLRGQGINLSDLYSTDFEENPLPTEEAWDIGALQAQGCDS